MIKHLAIAITLSLIFTNTYSQNFIGMSKSIAIQNFKATPDFGRILTEKQEDYSLVKFFNQDESIKKILFFNSSENCVKFIIINNNYTQLKTVVKELNKRLDKAGKTVWVEKGILDTQWTLEKKSTFFALTVIPVNSRDLTASNNR